MRVTEVDAFVTDRWTDIYEAEFVGLVRVAWLMLGDTAAAEDAVHVVFARLGDRAVELDNAGAYLRRAVANECRSVLRRRRVTTEKHHLFLTDSTTAPNHLVDFADALGGLSERQRIAVVMRVLNGSTDAEIAKTLGCRRGTVRSLVSRGLTKLRESL